MEPCLIGIEAREIAAIRHDVQLISFAFVEPYVKGQTNNAANADEGDLGLPKTARSALKALAAQLNGLEQEVHKFQHKLLPWHRRNATSQRLETIPGVGLITATALAVSVPDPTTF